ncbi:MAG: CerR family C-terminal domain-containing protein [Methylobacter sp.]|nr:CerR family C-terminal domain-containing protein [Methylobacter sp.]MDP2097606.1 CerR family C-terminal domain-containing protein [Methylobacter sp.]MDP2428509.1 CerR family C-terminal domain-containing protein [Methylobacter sp.]MDP3056253.1 CerR family C-terminal domain-containing protein [Methylobacter sp.]MDP3363784.1 CerR family C-terminal domain-containing protein [Methylobacter sp.]
MPDHNPPPLKTRQRLLVTASRVFAEKGYQDATIAEICEQAETNIASVNYHFGDKENLYLEAWRHAFQEDLRNHPSDGGIDADASAEVRLAGRIHSLITRISDPNSSFFAIVHKEMARQTSLLEKIMAQEINPERQALIAIIKELLGHNATDKQIQFCHASIIGQCFHLLKVKNMKLSCETRRYMMDLNDANAFAEHIVQFSLAGIAAIKHANIKP